jgi:hypothetical protein
MVSSQVTDYDNVTPLEWAEYEFATIEYDFRIPLKAAQGIREIMKRLAERVTHKGKPNA